MKAWNLETFSVANRDAEDNRDKEGVELCSALTPLGAVSEWSYLHRGIQVLSKALEL